MCIRDREKALTAMGITDLFDVSRADLRAMGSAPRGNNLYVSSVLHKTYLELDEHGTKAAAATPVQVNGGSAQPNAVKTVTLDRPFLYMVVDTHACVCLLYTSCSSALNAGLFSPSGPRGHHVCQNSLPLRPKSMRTCPTAVSYTHLDVYKRQVQP